MTEGLGKAYGMKVKELREKGYSKQASKFWASTLTRYVPKGRKKRGLG